MFIVGKSFFREILSTLNIKTIEPLLLFGNGGNGGNGGGVGTGAGGVVIFTCF